MYTVVKEGDNDSKEDAMQLINGDASELDVRFTRALRLKLGLPVVENTVLSSLQ